MRGQNYAELQAFVAIAERGSFVRAAEELQVSPSALSQTIRSLEERMGVRLFNRTTRSVSLTIAGEHLLERLRPALQEVANAVENACLFGEKPSGRLRVHALRLASRVFLEPIFQPFSEAYPEIELDVVLDDRPVDIVAEGFDATLRLGELIEQDMVGIKRGQNSGRFQPPRRVILSGTGIRKRRMTWKITAVSTGAGQARSIRIAGNSSVTLSGSR